MRDIFSFCIFMAVFYAALHGVTLPNGNKYKVQFSTETGVEFVVREKK